MRTKKSKTGWAFLRRFGAVFAALMLVLALFAPGALAKKNKSTPTPLPTATPAPQEISVEKGGEYSDKDHVALYLHLYGELPANYITKKEAQALGWVSSKGNLWKVAPGKSIGGDYFGNYEQLLPTKKGRSWHECDIDFDGQYRNAKRILYSTDGLIYYTEDHYETFVQITFDE